MVKVAGLSICRTLYSEPQGMTGCKQIPASNDVVAGISVNTNHTYHISENMSSKTIKEKNNLMEIKVDKIYHPVLEMEI